MEIFASLESKQAKVEADLLDYLTVKNVPGILKDIVETLLLEKPTNPIQFIHNYLPKKYPEEFTDLVNTSQPNNSSSNISALIVGASTATNMQQSTDDEENDESPMNGKRLSDLKFVQSDSFVHRKAISAESMDPAKLQEQFQQITSIEKSAEVTKDLLQVVSKSPLLRFLDSDQKDLIVKAFTGPITFEEGADIIKQGDFGDVIYLLDKGIVDVYVMKPSSSETNLVHTYAHGDSFGELALMYNTARAATCRARTVCELWSLDRISYRCIVVAAAMKKRELYKSFLFSVPLLQSLTELEIEKLSDALVEEKYEDGSLICKQGDVGSYFYIVLEGEALCIIQNHEEESIVASLTKGNYFGEVALITSKPRQATVQAKGNLTVLSIDRATFIRVLGPVTDIMKRNMEEYKKFAAKTI